jgi:hypothetical protein
LAHLSDSRIKALTVLDDDSIQTLNDGGEVAGMTLDDIDRMSVRELRTTLRDERTKRNDERETYDKNIKRTIEEKNAKITDLELILQDKKPRTEFARKKLDSLHLDFATALSSAEEEMRKAIRVIDDAQAIPNITFEQLEAFTGEYKERFNYLCDMHEDLVNAFNFVHVPKEAEHEESTQ